MLIVNVTRANNDIVALFVLCMPVVAIGIDNKKYNNTRYMN